MSVAMSSLESPRSSVFTFESSVHSGHVLRCLDDQRRRDLLCDITVLAEGRSFRAHRSVLASCSDYFTHRVSSHAPQGLVVTLPQEVTASGFEPLLQFAYTSKLLFSKDTVMEIRHCASILGFRDLDSACFDFLLPKFFSSSRASFQRKTCCKTRCRRQSPRAELSDIDTNKDVLDDDKEVKVVSDSPVEQDVGGQPANDETGRKSKNLTHPPEADIQSDGQTDYSLQCPKYRKFQQACGKVRLFVEVCAPETNPDSLVVREEGCPLPLPLPQSLRPCSTGGGIREGPAVETSGGNSSLLSQTQTDQAGQGEVEQKTDQAGQGEVAQKTDQAGQGEVEQKTDQAGQVEVEQKTDQAGQVEVEQKTDQAGQGEVEQKTDQAGQGEVEQKTDQAGQGEVEQKTDQAGQGEVEQKTDQAGQGEVEQKKGEEDDEEKREMDERRREADEENTVKYERIGETEERRRGETEERRRGETEERRRGETEERRRGETEERRRGETEERRRGETEERRKGETEERRRGETEERRRGETEERRRGERASGVDCHSSILALVEVSSGRLVSCEESPGLGTAPHRCPLEASGLDKQSPGGVGGGGCVLGGRGHHEGIDPAVSSLPQTEQEQGGRAWRKVGRRIEHGRSESGQGERRERGWEERSSVEREVAEHLAHGLWSEFSSSPPLLQDFLPGTESGNLRSSSSTLDWLHKLDISSSTGDCPFLHGLDRETDGGTDRGTGEGTDRGTKSATGLECEGSSQLEKSPCVSSLTSGDDGDSDCFDTEGDSESCSYSQRIKELPFSVGRIVGLSRNDFQLMLRHQPLTREQLDFIHDVRRRSKNRIAARRCRKRKLDCIHNLECAIDKLRTEKNQLISERSHLNQMKLNTWHSVTALCQKVCSEAALRPEQLQVLAKYTSPDCPLSALISPTDPTSPGLGGLLQSQASP
ncbi:transcription regulator protein BACH1-like isoform X2 [Salvelinus fontinalis]|uniref:transcription regulator protein BACH1-like isoform X2 n=1 Tax=Salvelinus fontinalis TaxID=8038 RepID=UPI002485FC1F|nr:transcription regulator protein BACH1-like isoform X2 [Salvelinus fontinalis]